MAIRNNKDILKEYKENQSYIRKTKMHCAASLELVHGFIKIIIAET